MKNLYDKKNKGKVHPSPFSASSSFCPHSRDALSLLTHLLPATIIALASALTLSDQEVLAYLITRSINSSLLQIEHNNNKCKRRTKTHKSPIFSCDCFDCYTCYWVKWDSSPNRDLIHKAIEAFEEHLINTEHRSKNTKSKKKDKMGRRSIEKQADSEQIELLPVFQESVSEKGCLEGSESPENEAFLVSLSDEMGGAAVSVTEEVEVVIRVPASNPRSSGRKSWPDVLGLFHSRFWSLWGPNI